MSPISVVHVNAETTWRGGENQVFLLASGMSQHRSCAVACVTGSPLATRMQQAGVPVLAIPGDRGLLSVLALRRIIREQRPELLHAHTSRAHQLCLLAALGTSLPVVVTRRVDFPLKRGAVSGWKYRNKKVHLVAISQAIRQVLITGGVEASGISLIPSGIDFAMLDAAPRLDPRSEFDLPSDALIVLNVAALSDHKDHTTLLRAWTQIERDHARAHLIIAGEGELRGQLTGLVNELGLRRAHLVGYRQDVPGLMKGSDLFVMSSHLEGLCTSIMDAKRCALPVVATRAGGIPEVVNDGSDGRLVAVRDPPALAQALSVYLSDHEQRQRSAANARSDSERFSAAAMVDSYLTLYDRLIPRT